MSGFYICPRCSLRFSPEEAAAYRYQCTERGCRIPRGSYDRLGRAAGSDHEELYFVTRSAHGNVWHQPNSLNPSAEGRFTRRNANE
jgi:hypothetical protein